MEGRGTGSGAAAEGLGVIGHGLCSGKGRVEGREGKSEQGSGDIVLGRCRPEWAESI